LGQPFYSSATFNDRSLSSEGFTARGLVGTWTINGTSESINVYIGSTEQAPAPLPLFGVAAAFGWSRRLRLQPSAEKAHRHDFNHPAPGLIAALNPLPGPAIGGAFFGRRWRRSFSLSSAMP
jgi:MYXO-CTERM domain-containing protein